MMNHPSHQKHSAELPERHCNAPAIQDLVGKREVSSEESLCLLLRRRILSRGRHLGGQQLEHGGRGVTGVSGEILFRGFSPVPRPEFLFQVPIGIGVRILQGSSAGTKRNGFSSRFVNFKRTLQRASTKSFSVSAAASLLPIARFLCSVYRNQADA